MNLQPIKYHKCEQDQGQGILLVDIESETIPRTDAQGNKFYYCMLKHHIFVVNTHRRDAHAGEQEEPEPPAQTAGNLLSYTIFSS